MEIPLLETLRWRYAVKKFEPSKKISDVTWKALEESAVLTPSSYGIQPWKFIVVQNTELRKKLREASWNQAQVEDCSHFVVLCAREKVSAENVDHYIQRISEIRGVALETLEGFRKGMLSNLVNNPNADWVKAWAGRQCYIALGQWMLAAATLHVDACPMEGLDPKKYDEILQLEGTGFYTVLALAFGYRHPEDKLGKVKKVRFDISEIIEHRN